MCVLFYSVFSVVVLCSYFFMSFVLLCSLGSVNYQILHIFSQKYAIQKMCSDRNQCLKLEDIHPVGHCSMTFWRHQSCWSLWNCYIVNSISWTVCIINKDTKLLVHSHFIYQNFIINLIRIASQNLTYILDVSWSFLYQLFDIYCTCYCI